MDRKDREELNSRRMNREEFGTSRKASPFRAQQKFIAEHTVAKDKTLSQIALKYYKSAVKEKWMLIYEANKGVIGDDPGKIQPGQVLKIPELSE